MNLTAIEKEIRRILTHIERWRQQGYTPSIEQGIVLNRLQKVYDLLLDQETRDAEATGADQTDMPTDGFTAGEAEQITPAASQPEDEPVKWDPNPTGDEAREEDPYGGSPVSPVPIEESTPAGSLIPKAGTDNYEIFGQNIPGELREEFIKDLFLRDETFFANEMSKLEAMPSLDDALIYIGEKYNWSAGNPSANRFIELMSDKLS